MEGRVVPTAAAAAQPDSDYVLASPVLPATAAEAPVAAGLDAHDMAAFLGLSNYEMATPAEQPASSAAAALSSNAFMAPGYLDPDAGGASEFGFGGLEGFELSTFDTPGMAFDASAFGDPARAGTMTFNPLYDDNEEHSFQQ